ncbi:MAG TPA: hypothetical protein RMH99_14210 [Sandaracinaceae bacterium LLY-WYZ-13_1]|nr:hypothetical protein [Sandaracinaceae bacterium LLY-WYZ-13_1]
MPRVRLLARCIGLVALVGGLAAGCIEQTPRFDAGLDERGPDAGTGADLDPRGR